MAVVTCVVAWILLEGLHSLYRGDVAHHSVLSTSTSLLRSKLPRSQSTSQRQPAGAGDLRDDSGETDWVFDRVLNSREQLEQLFDELKASGVALGNSPYRELRSEQVAFNYTGPDGCLRQKPNLHRYLGYIRSPRWYNFDPVSFFYADPNALTPRVKAFLDRYAFRQVQYTTNAAEERTTLPVNSRSQKIVVAGDSVVAGAMLGDDETIPSHLQKLQADHQVINIGINRADPNDVVCASERAAKRYPEQISTFVFVWCENDFRGEPPFNDPAVAMAKVGAYAKDNKIARVLVVYSPYIYNTVPEITRIENVSDKHATYVQQYHALRRAALEQGFVFLSIADIVDAVRKHSGTQFGPLAMYVDHAHLSNYGAELVAREIARHIPR
jgi:lysophospholipase L1-like esterase